MLLDRAKWERWIAAVSRSIQSFSFHIAGASGRRLSIGEIIGGSQREERLHILDQRIAQFGLNPDSYQWYRDLRRYGTVPHAGFGLGFERLVVYVCGLTNIRDAIPYPRVPGSAEF